MSLKEQLTDIDLQLEVMPEKNRMMVYASVLLAIVAFAYYFFGVSLQEEFRVKEEKLIELEAQIAENKLELFKKKIAKNQKNILVLNQEYEDSRFKQTSLQVSLERMDYLSSDAKGLADILQRLLKRSVILGVSIDKITMNDKEQDYKAYIREKGSIKIEGRANFLGVIKLIRFIESQEALIEVKNVHFELEEANKTPRFVIMITGYGISI